MRTAGRFRPFFRVRFQRRSNGAELNICLPPWVVKRLRETVHEWVLKSMVFERIFIVLIQAKKQSLTKCVRPVNILNYWNSTMKPMTYKGYSARIEYSDEDDCFIGRLAGIRDIITFHGNFVEEVRNAFQEAVDFYLETCRQRNEAPQKPYSGKISLRISPNIHARMAMQADAAGKSINQWVAETLEHAIHA